MKSILPILFILFVAASSHGQSNKPVTPDTRLLAVYDSEYLAILTEKQPQLIQRLNYDLDHSYYITSLPSEKHHLIVSTIKLTALDDLNILAVMKQNKLNRSWLKQSAFQIKGTNQQLILESGQRCVTGYNSFLKKSNQ